MPNYSDLANSGVSLAEIAARMKAKREARRQAEAASSRPPDAVGGQQTVSLPGEAPIQAQPVAGQRPQYDVRVGTPQIQQAPMQSYTMQPIRAQVPAQQQPINPQDSMDPRLARVRALMSQGLTFQQAMQKVQAGV